jgi:Tfp pilus assembly protein PilF
MGELSSDYFTTTPQVLEAVGGKVPVTINGKFPEKYFKKNAVVTVTPVLKWDGGQATGASTTFQGEKVEGNNKTIYYKAGGNYTMKTSFDYIPEMAKSELYLEFDAKVGNKSVSIPAVKVADGVIATSELVKNTLRSANPANAEDAFQRVIQQAKQANIMFLIQQANVRASELNSDPIKEFYALVKEVNDNPKTNMLDNIEVSAYASPDGGYTLNDKLAEQRETNATKALNAQLKKSKVDAIVDTKYEAQDWEGFQELVAQSNIQDKELILRVLSMYQDPEQRESEIKNISSVYKDLADNILPQLRRARLTLNYQLIGRSDDEILEAFASDPSVLSVEELLYAATLVDTAAEQEKIYKKTVELYPSDARALNNLGELAYKAGDMTTAANYFNQALKVNNNLAEANVNEGLIALLNNDKSAAEAYLAKGSEAKAANEALGNYYIADGQYERAVNAFGNTKSNSAALAQILTKDYNKAKSTLSEVKNPDAYTSYLNAIIGARTNNSSMVIDNLKSAIAQDSSLASKAANDLEFSKFATSSAFKSLVK